MELILETEVLRDYLVYFCFVFPQSGPWRASLIAQLVKNRPAMQEAWVRFLVWEDTLKKGKAITPVFWPAEFHGHGVAKSWI